MECKRNKLSLAKLLLCMGMLVAYLSSATLPSQLVSAATMKTPASIQAWLDSVKNKTVKSSGGFGGECVDLARLYSQSVLGNDIGSATISGGAKDYATQAVPKGYIRIKYTPGFKAKVGDIAIWEKDGGGYGHMAVVYAVNGNDMIIYEQNYSGKRYVVSHTVRNYDRIYAGTGGKLSAVLRPTNLAVNQVNKPMQGANLDGLSLNGNLLTTTGWYWPGKSYTYQYVFVMNAKTGSEIARIKSDVLLRNDIKLKLNNQLNADASGFRVQLRVPIDSQVYIVIRRTNDSLGGTNGGYADHRFTNQLLSTSKNKANLEQLTRVKNMISTKGWFWPRTNYQYQYVFIMDKTTNREISRQLVNISNRPDVQNYLGNLTGAARTGFSVTMQVPTTKPSYIMIRRTNDRAGNTLGGAEDIRFSNQVIPSR